MKQFLRLITVSQIEYIVALFLLVGLVLYVSFSAFSTDGYVQQYFHSLRHESTVANEYDRLSAEINSSDSVGNMAIFIFWSIIGLIVYYIAYFFFISERNTAEFFAILRDHNTDKVVLLEYEFARMAIRVGAIIFLLLGLGLFVRTLLPYIILTLNITLDTPLIARLTGIFLSMSYIFLMLHVGVVLLRCALLRQRIFFG